MDNENGYSAILYDVYGNFESVLASKSKHDLIEMVCKSTGDNAKWIEEQMRGVDVAEAGFAKIYNSFEAAIIEILKPDFLTVKQWKAYRDAGVILANIDNDNENV